MPRQFLHLLFLCIVLMISLLPLRVQAALPNELPASPTKFLSVARLRKGMSNNWDDQLQEFRVEA